MKHFMKSKGVQIMTNKIAIITGGSRGLSRNTAVNLAQRGAGCTVLLGARSEERGQQAVRHLERAGPR
jgi:NAD(P)-dependent dehydrogenase (short-subunit alcohol dehydrogenase family)